MAAKNAVKKAVFSPIRRLSLPKKIRARSPLWIHFGCGSVADPRFINVDARFFPHIDYLTKSPAMPAVPKGAAELIYACHVFEHVSYLKQVQTLSRWGEILRPGGKLMLSVPDFDKLIGLYKSGDRDLEGVQPALMGGQEYPGNFHFAIFSREHLGRLLVAAGFTDVQLWRSDEQPDWPKDWSWDEKVSLNILATKH